MTAALALFGSPPAFREPIELGPVHVPSPSDFEGAMRGIFERRYFANNGPLVVELDAALARAFGVAHAVSVTNEMVALMILMKGLERNGEIVVPAFAPTTLIDAVTWAGSTPVRCDVDPLTHMLSPATIAPVLSARTVGIAGVHLWGHSCATPELIGFARERSLKLIFDASQAAGSRNGGHAIGGFGAGEAFSFHATSTIDGAEGGAITTNDDELAKKLRTIRNFGPPLAPVAMRLNGKMSEAQAALALLSLGHLRQTIDANANRYRAYVKALEGVPGITLYRHDPLEESNAQFVVLFIDATEAGIARDELLAALKAENVLCRRPFAHADTEGFPNSDRLSREALLLPNAETLSAEQIRRIGELVREIVKNAPAVSERLRSRR